MLKLGRVAIFNQVARKGLSENAVFEQLAHILRTDPYEDSENRSPWIQTSFFSLPRRVISSEKHLFLGVKMLDL